MLEKELVINFLEKIKENLSTGDSKSALENIDKIINNKMYNLIKKYKKMQQIYDKDNKKIIKIRKKINDEMNKNFC